MDNLNPLRPNLLATAGPIPRWLARCFPKLEELDLSNNRLTGTLPPYLATLPVISEVRAKGLLAGTLVQPGWGPLPPSAVAAPDSGACWAWQLRLRASAFQAELASCQAALWGCL